MNDSNVNEDGTPKDGRAPQTASEFFGTEVEKAEEVIEEVVEKVEEVAETVVGAFGGAGGGSNPGYIHPDQAGDTSTGTGNGEGGELSNGSTPAVEEVPVTVIPDEVPPADESTEETL